MNANDVVNAQGAVEVDGLSPPPVKNPYKVDEALDDIPGLCYALETFLASRMLVRTHAI